jgi:hypothetical protein
MLRFLASGRYADYPAIGLWTLVGIWIMKYGSRAGVRVRKRWRGDDSPPSAGDERRKDPA